MDKQPADPNPMPDFNELLKFPTIDFVKIGRSVLHFFTQRHSENTGGGPALDRELYDRQESDMERYWQGMLDFKDETG